MYKTFKKAAPRLYRTNKKKAVSAYHSFIPPTANMTATITLDKRLEHTTGGHNKFWEIKVVDNGAYHAAGYRFNVKTRYGKIDTRGMESNKDFTSQKACDVFVQSKINEKLTKGYVEVGAVPQVQLPVVPTKATLDGIRGDVRLAINNIKNSMQAGIQYEAIVTVIVGGEVIQETHKT